MKTFNEYLQDIFVRQFPMVLDDEMPDKFDAWVSDLDGIEVIAYAEQVVHDLNESYSRIARLADELEVLNEKSIMV